MKGFLCTATFLLAAVPAGCGSARLFHAYDLPESPGVDAAAWPELADTPTAPPRGSFGPGVPDPAIGMATAADLGEIARQAEQRVAALGQPVLTAPERARLAGGE